MLVMADNLVQLFFGWEAVGLASYLLIGFWYDRPAAVTASTRAFLINRVSDAVFVVGIGLLFSVAGSFRFADLFAARHEMAAMMLPGTHWHLITVACLCLFAGAMGKSAQFPLHVWLPGSMEGPTPVSALIHAATMVTAGIFMVARLSPLFELSDTVLSLMLVIGALTAFFMGLVAMTQNDIKQVIAYSTISQLGYMTLALGASAYSAALFHLTTHAFFKALLFLAAGVVILGMNHDQDIRNMGGLRRYMPVTWLTALVASLSLAGVPFFSGFYSKDGIIMALQNSTLPGSGAALVVAYLGLFVTAFYTFRLFFLVFHGKERFGRYLPTPAFAPEAGPDEPVGLSPGEKPHNSPRVMTIPLVLLAIPAFLIGGWLVGPMLFGDFLAGSLYTDTARHIAQPMAAYASGSFVMALHGLFSLPFFLMLAGAGIAAWFYLVDPRLPKGLANALPVLHRLLLNQYYLLTIIQKLLTSGAWFSKGLLALGRFSNFGESIITRLALALGRGFWKIGEIRLLDGFIVTGSAKLIAGFSGIIRHIQSGRLYHYAFVMIFGLLCFLLYFCR
jgi:NADH-quinone oxidoreductase subunit L